MGKKCEKQKMRRKAERQREQGEASESGES